jgi:ATP-dependent RNA/DNA helicase IGHMBP2
MTEITHVLELLKLEKEEDLRQFKTVVEKMPLRERVDAGYTWHPLTVVRTGFAIGEKAFVIVERTRNLNEPHQIREGSTVNFFTVADGAYKSERQGVVNYVSRNQMKIILNARDVPDWISAGNLGVSLLFDDRSYQEMERAMLKVIAASKDRLAEIRDIFYGKKPQQTDEFAVPIVVDLLNESQNAAVNHIINARDVAVVHGPPGTGKTTTLVQAIRLVCKRENTVLVTAPSNAAVDLLVEKLAAEGLMVVRMGNISRVDPSILRHTLDAHLAEHPESKHIKKVKIEAANLRREAEKFKRQFHQADRHERDHLKKEARELENWAKQLENRLIEQVLDGANVICATLVGSAHGLLNDRKFRTCFIDEASQALEPASWIPITKSARVVFAGDPFQLPPTVKSQEAQRGGFSKTLIEKALENFPETALLTVQYRMNQAIMGFSNDYFYGGKLTAHPSVEHRVLDGWAAVTFIDTAGCGFDEKIGGGSKNRAGSRYNPEEFLIIREHLLKIFAYFSNQETVAFEAVAPSFSLQNAAPELPSIAIISPYREQVVHIEQALQTDPDLRDKSLKISTIDGFQGQERDIIYISLVRSNTKHEIGFLTDYRRMNVAMTRAKKALIVVGDSATIGANSFYGKFLEYAEKAGVYQTAWEYMR